MPNLSVLAQNNASGNAAIFISFITTGFDHDAWVMGKAMFNVCLKIRMVFGI